MPRVGLYEADETPRHCPYCMATNTRTVKVWVTDDKRNRHRQCRECSKVFATVTPLTREEYLTKKRAAFLAN